MVELVFYMHGKGVHDFAASNSITILTIEQLPALVSFSFLPLSSWTNLQAVKIAANAVLNEHFRNPSLLVLLSSISLKSLEIPNFNNWSFLLPFPSKQVLKNSF